MATLRGTRLPIPEFRLGELPEGLQAVRGYSEVQTFFPSLGKLLNLQHPPKPPKKEIWLNKAWSIDTIDCSGTAGLCLLTLKGEDGTLKAERAYLKVTHLLDPVRWIRGEYSLPGHPVIPKHKKTWKATVQKLTDPWNQAYVEAIAAYALGRLREEGVSPHFNIFYGAFQAKADTYQYNLTEDYDSYRHGRWFWTGKQKERFCLRMVNTEAPGEPVANELLQYLQPPEELDEDEDEYEDSEKVSDADASEEELEDDGVAPDATAELISLHSGDDEMEEASSRHSSSGDESSGSESEESGSESDGTPEYKIYAEIPKFPVMLIASEANEGTLDSLFDDPDELGCSPGTPEWEFHWSAWLFQVIAALSVAQATLGLTHNDLHTNNIVWTRTAEEFFVYTRRDGTTFKVPTFGKLFRIIDFGRSIYQINGVHYISDDFRAGNDADGQYSFRPLHKFPQREVKPNPSFDLCRLAVSMFDALFPDVPDAKEGGTTLSSEEGFIVHETVSSLYNCVWRWMLDQEGHNVLVNPDGSERFPDFDLYRHIAAEVHGAMPSAQFSDPAFDQFQCAPSEVAGSKQWQLFC